MKDHLSKQKGQYRHVSQNTVTQSRVRPDYKPQPRPPFRPVAVKARTGFFYDLWMMLLTKLGRRKVFIGGVSKTKHFTITQRFNSHGGLVVSSPEKILHVPNNVYGVEGIISSVRKGTMLTETFLNIKQQKETVVWKVIELREPAQLLAKRVAREVEKSFALKAYRFKESQP